MSIDFWVPAAPRTIKREPCDYGRGEPHECKPGNRCGYCEDGVQETIDSPAPSLNVANVTGAALLRILGEESEPSGCWGPSKLPDLRRRIIRALSTPLAASEAYAARSHGARFIDCGLSIEQIHERLHRLDAVLAYAQANNFGVAWA